MRHHNSSDGVRSIQGVRECANCGARAASIRIQGCEVCTLRMDTPRRVSEAVVNTAEKRTGL